MKDSKISTKTSIKLATKTTKVSKITKAQKTHAIITSTNLRDVDFVINHWYKSIKENVNLKNIDIVLVGLDLSKEKIDEARKTGLKVYSYNLNGRNVVMNRFKGIIQFLKENNYENIIITDGGDVLFLDDVSSFLEEKKKKIQVVREYYRNFFFHSLINENNFSKENTEKIKKMISEKKVINIGVLVGNSKKIVELLENMYKFVKKESFGPDQVIINYLLYKNGFEEIDELYNFIPNVTKRNIKSKNSIFLLNNKKVKYKETNKQTQIKQKKETIKEKTNNKTNKKIEIEKIKIIHNAGGLKFFRVIKDFGYNNSKNKINKLQYLVVRFFFKISSIIKKLD
ncbi:MAG: hypothetical protein PHT94_02500 [Candidatus Nanoarchaeia archaeon]|nr:hypothetical protein [Candidatus Nanoarchaeia archaeon]